VVVAFIETYNYARKIIDTTRTDLQITVTIDQDNMPPGDLVNKAPSEVIVIEQRTDGTGYDARMLIGIDRDVS
jgi:hypothetical protein